MQLAIKFYFSLYLLSEIQNGSVKIREESISLFFINNADQTRIRNLLIQYLLRIWYILRVIGMQVIHDIMRKKKPFILFAFKIESRIRVNRFI